jgi:ABC-2 type transport system permease protein
MADTMTAWLSSTVGVVMASARHQVLMFLRAWRIPAVLGFVQPGVLLLVTLSLPVQVTPAYTSRAAIGVLLTSFWSFTIWTCAGILQRERSDGTLAPCLIGVRDFRLVIVGKSLGASVMSGLMIAATESVVLAAFRYKPRFDHPEWLPAGLAALLLSGLTLGVGLSSLFVLTRFGPQLSAALMYPIFLLGGLLTPLSALPSAIRWLSWGVSLRWAMAFLTSTTAGTPDMFALGMVIVLTIGYAAVAAMVFNRFTTLVRMKGTIDFV